MPVDDVTDRRNRKLLNCGPSVPDTAVARNIRAVLAKAIVPPLPLPDPVSK